VAKVRVFRAHEENLPFDHGALDVIVLQDNVLLQALYREIRVRVLQLREKDLATHTTTLKGHSMAISTVSD
jgi:hypothetical protein